MKKHAKNMGKQDKIRTNWKFVGSGFVVIIILVVLVSASYGQNGSNPLADAIMRAQTALVELFVMAIAALMAAIKGIEK